MRLGGMALVLAIGSVSAWSCGGDDDKSPSTEGTVESCTDAIDNDADDFVDCDDQDCQIYAVCVSDDEGEGGSAGAPEPVQSGGAAGKAGETNQAGMSLQLGGSAGDAGATERGGEPNAGGRAGSGGSIQGGGGSSVGGRDSGGGSPAQGGGDADGGTLGLGGGEESGGTTAAGGAGEDAGATSLGGSPSVGGRPGVGGAPVLGGSPSVGGRPGAGGAPVLGGSPSVGGRPGVGGAPVLGGSPSVGGRPDAGGAPSVGGTPNLGGTTPEGGSGLGGAQPLGGTPGGGGSAGGGGTGVGGALGFGGLVVAGSAGVGCEGPLEERATSGRCVARKIPIDGGYFIDATEVTRGQYQDFLDSHPAIIPDYDTTCNWDDDYAPDAVCMAGEHVYEGDDADHHPVTCIDWCDARTYCVAAGKRLCGKIGTLDPLPFDEYDNPETSQWYRACSTAGVLDYPYGDEYDSMACNGYYKAITVSDPVTTSVAGSLDSCQSVLPGYSGVYDLSGNIVEWENSCESDQPGANCHVRGGAFVDGGGLNCANATAGRRQTVHFTQGFRCCSSS